MSEKVVRIIEDCRKVESPATGQLGMYEGDFPRTVIVQRINPYTDEKTLHEYMYDWWMTSGWTDYIPEYKGHEQDNEPHWMKMANPRIRLADGSYIWGAECWWSDKVDTSLDELQKEVDLFRELFAAMIAAQTPQPGVIGDEKG
jgi:hypothetical protein